MYPHPLLAIIILIVCVVVFFLAFNRIVNTNPQNTTDAERFLSKRTKTLNECFDTCMNTPSAGWCMDRAGKGKCLAGGLDGPFDPEARCSNWWYHGRCQWGPLCRRVDPVVPASRERVNPYHHPAPYNYRSWRTFHECVTGVMRRSLEETVN